MAEVAVVLFVGTIFTFVIFCFGMYIHELKKDIRGR